MDDFRRHVLTEVLKGTTNRLFVSYGRRGAYDGSAVGVVLKREGTKGANLIEISCDCGWPLQTVHKSDFYSWTCCNCGHGLGEVRREVGS